MTRPAPRAIGWESVVLPPPRARRTAGLLAAGTIGLSTALLGFPGVASADPSGWTFSSADPNPIVVPAGTCAVDWTIIGSRGGADANSFSGPSPIGSKIRTAVGQGETFTLSVGAPGADAVDGGAGGTNPQGGGAYDGGNRTADDSGGGGAASVVMRNGSLYLAGQGGLGQGAGGGQYGHAEDPFPDEKLPPEPGDQTFVSLAQGESQGYISGEGVACGTVVNPLVPTPGMPVVVPGVVPAVPVLPDTRRTDPVAGPRHHLGVQLRRHHLEAGQREQDLLPARVQHDVLGDRADQRSELQPAAPRDEPERLQPDDDRQRRHAVREARHADRRRGGRATLGPRH